MKGSRKTAIILFIFLLGFSGLFLYVYFLSEPLVPPPAEATSIKKRNALSLFSKGRFFPGIVKQMYFTVKERPCFSSVFDYYRGRLERLGFYSINKGAEKASVDPCKNWIRLKYKDKGKIIIQEGRQEVWLGGKNHYHSIEVGCSYIPGHGRVEAKCLYRERKPIFQISIKFPWQKPLIFPPPGAEIKVERYSSWRKYLFFTIKTLPRSQEVFQHYKWKLIEKGFKKYRPFFDDVKHFWEEREEKGEKLVWREEEWRKGRRRVIIGCIFKGDEGTLQQCEYEEYDR